MREWEWINEIEWKKEGERGCEWIKERENVAVGYLNHVGMYTYDII